MEDYIYARYYQWITGWANELCSPYGGPYSELMHELHIFTFKCKVAGDENRVTDAHMLRRKFATENGFAYHDVEDILGGDRISLLEVMLSLALRCEEEFMGNGENDRMSVWFFDMLCSAKLDEMDDAHFDPDYVELSIERIISRTYERNGNGGLFTVNNPPKDLRKTELWYQMCWHLSELVENDR